MMDEQKDKHRFEWDDQTVFKDTVLGYIYIPKAIAHKLIDHKIFQRLHDVAQTGMATLYPGATHNRFCHSIGVYYLGKQAFQNFQQNVKTQHEKIYYKVADSKENCERVWNRWRFLFEISCLLHDCGHSPLSHSLEFLYDVAESDEDYTDGDYSKKTVNKVLLDKFKDDENFKECFVKEDSDDVYGAPHERMSACLIVLDEGEGGYRDILRDLIQDQILYFNENHIYDSMMLDMHTFDEHYEDDMLLSDLEFIVRSIIGCPYNEHSYFCGEENMNRNIVYQLRNCIIRLLNGIIDADNIDYSIRDASASGYKSAQVDYERLIKSNTIALAYEQKDLRLKDDPFDYSVRLKHFISDMAKEENPICMTISGSATLVIKPDPSYKEEKNKNMSQEEKNKLLGLHIMGDIWEDDEHSSEKTIRVIHIREGSSAYLELKRGRLEIRPRDQTKETGTQLYIQSSRLSGKMDGTIFVGNRILSNTSGNFLQNKIQKEKLRIYPAYHKSALSVIQGALDAANFESRWIYSHHVTTYYNNFLSVFLLAKYSDFCAEEECYYLLRKLDDILYIFHSMQRELSNDQKNNAIHENVNAKLYQKVRESFESTTSNKKLMVEEKFPQTLPKAMNETDIQLFHFLLHVLNSLCGFYPIITHQDRIGMHLENAICNGIEKILKTMNGMSETASDISLLSNFEKKTYENILDKMKDIELKKQGMSVMNAILGMPYSQKIYGKKYYRISDSDLRSMYHSLAQNATEEQKERYTDLFDAIHQYESRNYLAPMWKSHAEFKFYTHGWKEEWFRPQTDNGKDENNTNLSRIENFFNNESAPAATSAKKEPLYTYFSKKEEYSLGEDLKDFWNEAREKYYLEVLVYVPQKIRHKDLKGNDTFVIWKNRIVSLKDIGLHTSQAPKHTYFYLYYRQTKEVKENPALKLDASEFMDFLRQKLEDKKDVSSSRKEKNE